MRSEIVALKRARILQAAADLFYQGGYENTTLEAVADRLGVRKPFIYSYYNSKSDLLAEICQRAIRGSLDAMNEVLALKATPGEKLRRLGIAFTLAVLDNQKYMAIFSREEKNLLAKDFKRIGAMRRDFDRQLKKLLDQGSASGDFVIMDRSIAALAIGGMVSWAYVWFRPSGRLDSREIATRMTELMVTMVGAGAKPARPRARAERREKPAPKRAKPVREAADAKSRM